MLKANALHHWPTGPKSWCRASESWRCSCDSAGRQLDGTHDPRIGAATAQVTVHGGADFLFARARVARQQLAAFHDHPVDAVAALGCLHVDESLLQRM